MLHVVITAEGWAVDPESAFLHADDLGVLHGDGLFETMLVRDGRVCGVERHLDRLRRSAAAAGLPVPNADRLRTMVAAGLDEWEQVAADECDEGILRIVYTPGREADPVGGVTLYLTISEVPVRVEQARRDGVRAVTLPTAYEPGLAARAPWLLTGVKSLSYAVNVAALRHARTLGADDAIFVASDGTVLEGPRSSVVAVIDGTLVTPMRDDGILPGTTQDALFELAAREGVATAERQLTVDDLLAADEVWLLSSITLAARVRELDGQILGTTSVLDVAALVEESAGS